MSSRYGWILTASLLLGGGAPKDASVRIVNGDGRCSGTLFCSEKDTVFGLSAAHCFVGRIGGKFQVETIDGKSHEATLLAVSRDKDYDLALFSIALVNGIDVAVIPQIVPTVESYTGIGFSNGGGQRVKTLEYIGEILHANKKRPDNHFSVATGYFSKGDSGGGIFADGNLIGVMTDSEPEEPVPATAGFRHVYATQHQDILAFIDKHCPTCPPGRIPRVVPDPPEDSGTMPDVESSRRIRQLESRIAQLEQRAAAPGVPGKDGADGKDGQDAESIDVEAVVAEVLKRLPPSPRYFVIKPRFKGN